MPFKSRIAASTTRQANASSTEMPTTFTDGLALPKVLVFDLDYTLWPFWCDTHIATPVRPFPTGHSAYGLKVKDAYGGSYGFYSDVPGVLRACREKNVLVGAASRTYAPDVAGDLLDLLHVPTASLPTSHSSSSSSSLLASSPSSSSAMAPTTTAESPGSSANGKVNTTTTSREKARTFFTNLQIYPGNKSTHMKKISQQLNVRYEEMLFFDDEERNRNVERDLGVCFWLVRDGVTRAEVDRGVEKWRKMRGVKSSGVADDPKKTADASGVDVVLDRKDSWGSDGG